MKNFSKKIAGLFLILVLTLSLAACSGDSTEYTLLGTREQIITAIQNAMDRNQARCMFTVPSEELIDSQDWLNEFAGLKNINCEYRKSGSKYNVTITLSYWDNYPIVYAYRNNDESNLTPKQKELLERYKSVLEEIKGDKPQAEDAMMGTATDILAIHDYMVSNITYDSSIQDHFNAYDALINGRAICSGYAEVFKTFMDLMGVENMAVSGTADDVNHMWNLIKLDKWYHVDVTWDDPVGATSSNIKHTYFNIDDKAISSNHVWNTSDYPAADGSTYSYVSMRKLKTLNSQEELNAYISEVIKNRTTDCEVLVYGTSDLKAAFNAQRGVALSYSFSKNQLTEYTIYTIEINY